MSSKLLFCTILPNFITWPDSSFSNSDDFFIIAVLGQSRITEYLRPFKQNRAGRQIVIKTFPSIENVSDCHILFLSSETIKKQAYILNRLSPKAIITVSDQKNFVDNGGIIQLVTVRDRLRFMINKARADQLDLKIGSRLLALATDVKVDSHE